MVEEHALAQQPFHRRRILRVLVGIPLFCTLFLFLPAGTFTWLKGWLFIAMFLIAETISILYLWQTHPALLMTDRKHPCNRRLRPAG
jgi:hypothetical protein